ncbi:MAG: M67 family metallopeptidase [Ilumatobacteraceae bacterium]
MLRLAREALDDLVALAYEGYPEEACGLVAGPADRPDEVAVFYRCRNAAGSARVYTIDPRDHLRAEDDADDRGWALNGVVHSHTHSEPYPSPTDVAQAPDPTWHYVIVGLRREVPEVRSYRIVDGTISEERIEIC